MMPLLDFYFPFLVLAYGLIMTLVSHFPQLEKQAEAHLPHPWKKWFYTHRVLGLLCLIVGGLWSLQKIFF